MLLFLLNATTLLAPPWRCSSSTLLFLLLFLDVVAPQHSYSSYSLSMLFFLATTPFWHYCYFCSSSMLLFLFFFNVASPTIPWWSYSSTTFLLNVIIPPTPLQHYSCSYFRYFYITPWCCCCFPLHFSYLSYFRLVLSPPFHVFVGVLGTSFPNSTSWSQTWRWGFFFLNVYLFMIFFYYPFFWVILIDTLFVYHVQKLFEHCTFSFTHCISFAHLHYMFVEHIIYFL